MWALILSLFIQYSFAVDYSQTLYVDPSGNDSHRGLSPDAPLKTLYQAQKNLDLFMSYFKPHTTHKGDRFFIKIFARGIFYGQTMDWNHPHKNVHFELASWPGSKAEFYGFRHPCFDCASGTYFFNAYSEKTIFKAYKGFSGYGSVALRNLTIKYYGSGINIAAWPDTKPTNIEITGNTFYRIGQIANPNVWTPRYSAVMLKNIDNALIKDNLFMQIENKPTDYPEWIHGIYIKSSDYNKIINNHFNSISGEPVKLRDGSDYNIVSHNTFVRGPTSVHVFPVQNWYDFWYKNDHEVTTRELPSFGNVLDANTFQNGYVSSVSASDLASLSPSQKNMFCANRTIASPDLLPQSYTQSADSAKTYSRFIINGKKVYHTDWWQICSTCEKTYFNWKGGYYVQVCGNCTNIDNSFYPVNSVGTKGQSCRHKHLGPAQ